MQAFAYRFYSSKKWQRCRDSYRQAMHQQCEECGAPADLVHHVIPLTRSNINDPFITLSFDNLKLLCRKCHGTEHGTEVTVEGVCFDEHGDLVATPPPPAQLIGGLHTGGGTSL